MAVELFIQHNSTIQFPVVEEGARLTLERKGTPGKLEFTVVKGPGLNFAEGDPVKLTVNGTAMFYGFVFKKKRDKGGTIDVVAYDQLRYLKNKDTITEEGLKASDLLKRIATDFRLNLGTVEDTGYTLETIVEENQTLFDMIQSALDETLMNTKQLYVLYDDAGKLTLKNINTMKLNLLIDEETGENFSYESSIDEQTYNKIKLAYNDEKTGKRELFIAQDGAKMNQWGVLQYFEEVQTKTGASAKADALLKLYDQKTRKLTIQNAFGDVRVRAGSAVVVALNLGDIVTNNYMVVNKVTHTFRGDEHMMELDLIGVNLLPNPVEVVKRAAVEAVEAGKPVNILFGTVLSASPLKIQVDQKSIYTSKMLILTRNVTDFEVDMTVNHSTEDKGGGSGAAAYEAHKHAYVGKKTFKVHNALKAGEKVLLIRVQQGKKFVVIDRVKGA